MAGLRLALRLSAPDGEVAVRIGLGRLSRPLGEQPPEAVASHLRCPGREGEQALVPLIDRRCDSESDSERVSDRFGKRQ